MNTAHDIEGMLGFRVENGLLFHGENPRPATADESRLWNYAVTTTELNLSLVGQLKLLGADHDSVRASAEAYRAQIKRLYDFLAHEYPNIKPTDDAIEFAMEALQRSFEHECPSEPQQRTMKQTLDAHAVRDGFGTPAENRL